MVVGAVHGAAGIGSEGAPSDQAPGLASICLMIDSAAHANALPLGFFARVIWQESRFRPEEVGPMTRGGARALGIAQFMPATAAERHLLEPFNPVERDQNRAGFWQTGAPSLVTLGLRRLPDNAGPQRVRKFMTGSRGLPRETRNYVLAITGRSVDAWAKDGRLESNDGEKTSSTEMASSRAARMSRHSKRRASIGRSTIAAARGSKLV